MSTGQRADSRVRLPPPRAALLLANVRLLTRLTDATVDRHGGLGNPHRGGARVVRHGSNAFENDRIAVLTGQSGCVGFRSSHLRVMCVLSARDDLGARVLINDSQGVGVLMAPAARVALFKPCFAGKWERDNMMSAASRRPSTTFLASRWGWI